MLSWPEVAPRHGSVVLREFEPGDVDMVLDLATDPYVPLIGTLPAHADRDQSLAWIEQQRRRLTEGAGFSFAIADHSTNSALGFIGLWLSGWAPHESQQKPLRPGSATHRLADALGAREISTGEKAGR